MIELEEQMKVNLELAVAEVANEHGQAMADLVRGQLSNLVRTTFVFALQRGLNPAVAIPAIITTIGNWHEANKAEGLI